MATTNATKGRPEQKQRPVFARTYFPVQIAVFEHAGDNGRRNYSVKVTKSFRRDNEREWETTEYLGPQDLLPAAHLLTEAYAAIQTRQETNYRDRRNADEHTARF